MTIRELRDLLTEDKKNYRGVIDPKTITVAELLERLDESIYGEKTILTGSMIFDMTIR